MASVACCSPYVTLVDNHAWDRNGLLLFDRNVLAPRGKKKTMLRLASPPAAHRESSVQSESTCTAAFGGMGRALDYHMQPTKKHWGVTRIDLCFYIWKWPHRETSNSINIVLWKWPRATVCVLVWEQQRQRKADIVQLRLDSIYTGRCKEYYKHQWSHNDEHWICCASYSLQSTGYDTRYWFFLQFVSHKWCRPAFFNTDRLFLLSINVCLLSWCCKFVMTQCKKQICSFHFIVSRTSQINN